CYAGGAARRPPAGLEAIKNDLAVLRRDMHEAGVWVFAGALQSPDSATVVRTADGQVLVTDGPFVESKELIGGICVIRVASREEAVAWGERMSRATRTPIEVRPLVPHEP